MDSKQLNSLSPQLREIYDRVMSTTAHLQQKPAPAEKIEHKDAPKVSEHSPVAPPAPAETAPQAKKTGEYVTYNAHSAAQHAAKTAAATASKGKLSPQFLILAGILFFLIYAVFWMKLFSVKLPFLPF